MSQKTNRALVAIDFFCSAGGVTCGFKAAGVNVLGGIDIDLNCKETYEKNNQAKFLAADVSTLDRSALTKEFGIRRGQRNLIFIGCSPCQYYSNIKTDKERSARSRLLLSDFQDFVAHYRPGFIFVENVPGFEKKNGSPIQKFKNFLINNNYVIDDRVLNAKDFGVPQNRRRYVLIATRVKRRIKLPEPENSEVLTIREVIGDKRVFPPIPAGYNDATDFIHSSAALSDLNLERIKATAHDGGDRRTWPEGLQLNCYRNHTGHYDVYGRMYWDKPSPTITTRFNSYSNGRYGHPVQDRAISLREGAILQSFPLKYKFYSQSVVMIAKMIGNAVPPELARRIAKQFF